MKWGTSLMGGCVWNLKAIIYFKVYWYIAFTSFLGWISSSRIFGSPPERSGQSFANCFDLFQPSQIAQLSEKEHPQVPCRVNPRIELLFGVNFDHFWSTEMFFGRTVLFKKIASCLKWIRLAKVNRSLSSFS